MIIIFTHEELISWCYFLLQYAESAHLVGYGRARRPDLCKYHKFITFKFILSKYATLWRLLRYRAFLKYDWKHESLWTMMKVK